MARTARATVDQIYSAFGKGDMPGVFDTLSPDIVWRLVGRSVDVPYAGEFRGHVGVQKFFEGIGGAVEIKEFGPQEIIDAGDKIVALGREHSRVKATGRSYETDWVHVFHVKDGKIVRFQEFMDTGTMAKAFAK
jgi:ketosteroid isomerase-like protein